MNIVHVIALNDKLMLGFQENESFFARLYDEELSIIHVRCT